jgi:hypothetical protein
MAILASIVHADPPPATRAGPLEPVILALMKRDPAARPGAIGARRLLTAACSSYGERTSANDGARDPGRADGGGNGATADGVMGESGVAGGTRPAGGTLPLPAFLAQDDGAFAGLPPAAAPAPTVTASPLPAHLSPAALVTASTLAASGTAPASSAPLGPLNQSRRPGRHRRALLFGGRTR